MRPFLAGCALFASLASAPELPPATFTLAILRRDAIVIPFATYDGKRWKDHWREPSKDVDVPINLRSVPAQWWGPGGPIDAWQVWVGANPPRTVHVRQPDWFQTHCSKQVGLRTDYQPSQWPPGSEAQPYPKDGLAVSPPQPVEAIETPTSDSPERKSMADALRGAFAAREDVALERARLDGSPVRASRKDLEALPITVEALYAFGATRRVYWVEAVREYKQGGACAAVVFGSGWFVRNFGRSAFADFDVSIVPCDRDGLSYMLPLGVMPLAQGLYWIAQWSGWDHEEYDILEIGARSIAPVLTVSGGSC
jgi:hypothetical protein